MNRMDNSEHEEDVRCDSVDEGDKSGSTHEGEIDEPLNRDTVADADKATDTVSESESGGTHSGNADLNTDVNIDESDDLGDSKTKRDP